MRHTRWGCVQASLRVVHDTTNVVSFSFLSLCVVL
jgi:hypothetical protein